MQALPSNVDAEINLLGAILVKSDCIMDAINIINADDFYKDSHKIIFTAMEDMFQRNVKIDLITLAEKLKDTMDKVGGITYISELAGAVGVSSNVKEYAQIIKEKSNKRKLIRMSELLKQKAYEDKEASNVLVNNVEEELFKINLNKENRMESLDRVLSSTMDHIEDAYKNKDLNKGITGIDTGIRDINRMTAGLQRQDLIVLAARPSMGKTTLAVNIATNVSKNKVVAMFSLEMSKEQIARKILASKTHIDLLKINTGNLEDRDWSSIGSISGPLANNKLFIDDTGGLSVAEIKAKAKKIKLQHGLDLIIIDYLQLMVGKGENRTQEVSGISRGLKQIAKDLDITILVLSQLSRAPEARTDHRPKLADLRESGSIEQDADLVWFLYRDEYYNSETEDKNIAECIFAKNRNGRVGTIKLAWLGQFQLFGQLDYVHEGSFNPEMFKDDNKDETKVKQEVMNLEK